jgi:tRNA A-37 threonylcarbamoyl transferase component Bud32/tetratricopeptide (TPR) repeat protein
MPTPIKMLRIKSVLQFAIEKSIRRRSSIFAADRIRWRGVGIVLLICAVLVSAVAAQNQNDAPRAQKFYEKALQEKNPAARVELLQKAAQCFGQPTTLAPAGRQQAAMIHFALGREFFQQTKWQPAVMQLEHAVGLDSTFLPAHNMLGLIYFQQKKYEAAIAAYQKVLRSQPTAQLYNNLGAAHEANGELNAAVEAYRRALELDAKLSLAQKNLRRIEEKLTLASPVVKKSAAADSLHPAAQPRDSLVSRQQSSRGATKTAQTPLQAKPAKKQTFEKTVTPANQPVAEKPAGKKVAAKTGDTLRTALQFRGHEIFAPLNPVSADTPLAAVFPVRDSALTAAIKPASAASSAPLKDAVVPATPRAPKNSVLAYLCGAGVILFGVFIFTQRRRLSRVWLQFKPALAAPGAGVVRDERLIPATAARQALNKSNGASDSNGRKSPVAETHTAAATGSSATTTNDRLGSQDPSLQTQAFFAEMIAADPELYAFVDEWQETPATLEAVAEATNGQADLPAAEASPLSENNEAAHHTDPLISPAPPAAASTAPEENENTGLQPPQTESINTDHAEIPSPRDEEQPTASNQQPASSIEQQTLGRYLIEREIGKGAMGKIYLAFDPKLDRRVVIKTVCFNLAASAADTAALKDRIYREARAIAKLSHPNIVVVYDVEDDKELSYIVMEHLEGRDLRQALQSEHRFDYPRAIKIVAQVCSALDYAHQAGIIHRDIKPSNIMLLPDDKAKVTDFGIAKIADNFSLTLPGHVLGTPSYMAPEQFEEETFDGRADIFSLGVVFYELLTGSRPFAGDSLAALAYKIVHKMHIPPSLQNVELPLELDEIVHRALAKQPEERYQTAQEFREALLAVEAEAAL